MPKGKLNVALEDLPRLQAAAEFCGVELGEGNTIGNKAVVECSFKQASALFECGRLLDTISSDDLDAFLADKK